MYSLRHQLATRSIHPALLETGVLVAAFLLPTLVVAAGTVISQRIEPIPCPIDTVSTGSATTVQTTEDCEEVIERGNSGLPPQVITDIQRSEPRREVGIAPRTTPRTGAAQPIPPRDRLSEGIFPAREAVQVIGVPDRSFTGLPGYVVDLAVTGFSLIALLIYRHLWHPTWLSLPLMLWQRRASHKSHHPPGLDTPA